MGKDRVIEILDQAQLDIMDVKNLMDDNHHFHRAGELEAVSKMMSYVIRSVQRAL